MQTVPGPDGGAGAVSHPGPLAVVVVGDIGDVRRDAVAVADRLQLVGRIVGEGGAAGPRNRGAVAARILLRQAIARPVVAV